MGGVAVEAKVGDVPQTLAQEVGEVGVMAIVGFLVADGEFEGGGHADDEGDVFGAGAAVAFLGAALDLGYDAGAASDVKDADALGAVKFVGGEGEEINAESVDVEGESAGRLDGVGVEGDAGTFQEGGDFGDRLDGADFVVGVVNADQGEVVAEEAVQVAEVDDAVLVDAEIVDVGAAVAAEILGGAQDGVVFDAGNDEAITTGLLAGDGSAFDGQVGAFAAAAGEDELAGLAAKNGGDAGAGVFEGVASDAGFGIEAGGVVAVLGEEREHGGEDGLGDRSGGGVVEVDAVAVQWVRAWGVERKGRLIMAQRREGRRESGGEASRPGGEGCGRRRRTARTPMRWCG